ncbi:hypothetical protein J2S74_002308 [Evansella vedderi]|uniref:Phage protein n=1 Tax=Evansella vedderi TaxID=38282 RepID=A0ABT9ZUK2_9BACI|nr:hypothetical protein [Evansella vedderi]MDQ0254926.1 hypothetical protein [Evansella vedderi]
MIGDYFTDEFTVKRNQKQTVNGRTFNNPVTLGTIKGAMDALSGDQRFAADQSQYSSSHELFTFADGVAVKKGDQIIDEDDQVYTVKFIDHNMSMGHIRMEVEWNEYAQKKE